MPVKSFKVQGHPCLLPSCLSILHISLHFWIHVTHSPFPPVYSSYGIILFYFILDLIWSAVTMVFLVTILCPNIVSLWCCLCSMHLFLSLGNLTHAFNDMYYHIIIINLADWVHPFNRERVGGTIISTCLNLQLLFSTLGIAWLNEEI